MLLKKSFSVFVSAVFLFSVIFPDIASAVATPSEIANNISFSDKPADNSFGSYAQVTSVADYGGDTAVLNVQDFHMHPEVQRNISAVIDIMVKKYGVDSVFVEGAYGKVSTKWLSDMKNGYLGRQALDNLLESGTITGVEYYSALNDKNNFLLGLEDEKIHKANVQRLGSLLGKQQYYDNALAALQKELDFFQAKYFNARNKKLSKLVKKHKEGKISSAKYYTLLFNYLKKNSDQSHDTYGTLMPMDMSDYPNICLLLHSYKLQDSLNVKKINKDLNKLVAALKESVSFSEYKKILEQTGNFQDMYQLVSYLSKMPEDFKNKHFSPGIAKYIEVTSRAKQINPVDLIAEERFLVQEIRIALSSGKNELEISFLSDFFLYFCDYLKTSISADDYAYLKGSFDRFVTLWNKYSFHNKTMRELQEDFAFLNEYYEINDNRNEIFIKQIEKSVVLKSGTLPVPVTKESASAMLENKKNIIVCVTGGYHSKGLTELLAGKKVSFIVITPSVSGNVESTLAKYEREASEQAKIFSQSLALSLFSQIVSHGASGNLTGAKRMAVKLFISAAGELENADFENIGVLIENLNAAMGGERVFSYDAAAGEVSINSSDGKYSEPFIEVRKNSDGKISVKNKYLTEEDKSGASDLSRQFTLAEMKKFAENFGKVLRISSFDFGSGVFIPKMYAAGVNIINWAAENNIFLDIDSVNGASFEMTERYGFDDKILSDNPEVAKYGEQWQSATLKKYLRTEDFKNGNMPAFEKLLFAAGFLDEFIPVSEKTLDLYDKYPARAHRQDENNDVRGQAPDAASEALRKFIGNNPAYGFLAAMKRQYEKANKDSSVIDRLWKQYSILGSGSDFSADGMTVREITDMFAEKNALSDEEKTLNAMKYGTAGYRAEFGARLNYVHILVNAQAIAEVAKERFAAAKAEGGLKNREKAKIFVGYDTRFMSKEFAETMSAVFAANGVEAVLSSVDTPTPAISWLLGATRGEEYDLAVNITASHNPFEYDGIKVNEPFGGQAGSDITSAIENKMGEISAGRIKIKYENPESGFSSGNIAIKDDLMAEYVSAYIEMFKRQFNIKNEADFDAFKEKAKNFFFVADVKSGTTPKYYEEIMKALGIENYEIINDEFDPTFGGEDPNPDKNTAMLKERVEAVKKENPGAFVYGLATDPDGDRMAVIENGKTFTTDEIIIYNQYRLLEKAVQTARQTGKKQEVVIVPNLATTGALELLKKHFERRYPGLVDIKIIRTNIGFKWIAEVLKEAKDANPEVITMGAEESGAVVVGGLTLDKDGLVATFGSASLAIDTEETIESTLKRIYSDEVLGWMPQKKMESVKFESMSDLSEKGAYLEAVAGNKAVREAFIKQFERFSGDFKIERIEKIVGTSFEGIQIFTSNPKVLIIMRLSGTEPLVKVYAETDSEELTKNIISEGKNILNSEPGLSSKQQARTEERRTETIEDIGIVPGKNYIVRVDYNVPADDDTRILASFATVRYITERGGRVVLMSHFGRPDGKVNPELSLAPIAERASALLGKPIKFVGETVGEKAKEAVDSLKDGEILMLENVRFHPGEEGLNASGAEKSAKIDSFGKMLADTVGSDAVFVMDAFGAAHRAHGSTVAITKHVSKSVAGILVAKETEFLGEKLRNPESPSVAVIGGSKVKDKIGVINSLLEKLDTIIIGGAMAYSFLAARGVNIGSSLADEENINLARELLAKAEAMGKSIVLPLDHKVVRAGTVDFKNFALVEGNGLRNTEGVSIEDGYMGADIGEKTAEMYGEKIRQAKTVLWNGPMGIFEVGELAEGTYKIAQAMAEATEENEAVTIVGGGDSVSAANKSGVAGKMSHVSTGGGASLEFLEKGRLPAVESLDSVPMTNSMLEMRDTWNSIRNKKWVGFLARIFKNPLTLRSVAVALHEGRHNFFTMTFAPKKFVDMHFDDAAKTDDKERLSKLSAAYTLSFFTNLAVLGSAYIIAAALFFATSPVLTGALIAAAVFLVPFVNVSVHTGNNAAFLKNTEAGIRAVLENEKKNNPGQYDMIVKRFADSDISAESIPAFIVNNPEILESDAFAGSAEIKNKIKAVGKKYFEEMREAGKEDYKKLTDTKEWKALAAHRKKMSKVTMKELFVRDPRRAEKFTKKLEDLTIDFSKNAIDEETMTLLMELAKASGVKEAIEKIMSGGTWNWTEMRSVLHTALRNIDGRPVYVNGKDVMPEIKRVLEKMKVFSDKVRKGEWKGSTGKPVKDIISVGIGGSDLGPRMVTEALESYKGGINIRFVSSVDPAAFFEAVKNVDPETTLVIIESKTFTTQETMQNASLLKDFMLSQLKNKESVRARALNDEKEKKRKEFRNEYGAAETAEKEYKAWEQSFLSDENEINRVLNNYIVSKHFAAVSTNKEKVSQFGIDTDNMFEFWDFVGGRYSLWSAIGLPIACAVGYDNFYRMLEGANIMDDHFARAEYEENIPVIMGMLWVWYINFSGYNNHAVIAYSEKMKLFTKYLQQLIMESLGKRADEFGNIIEDYDTGAVVFGEVGPDSQHSFFQQLHMGTGVVPIDFITFLTDPSSDEAAKYGDKELAERAKESYRMLIANYLAQMQALAFGRDDAEVRAKIEKSKAETAEAWRRAGKSEAEIAAEMERLDRLVAQKQFDGNRPSNAILLKELNPKNLGMLIALYEHITLVQSVIWRINAYDQWGVELGKEKAGNLLPAIRGQEQSGDDMDSSTQSLLKILREAQRENEKGGQAIMERNYPKVFASLIEGNSALGTVLRMFKIELPVARSNAADFIKGHIETDKSAAGDFSYAVSKAYELRTALMRSWVYRTFTALLFATAAFMIMPSVATGITAAIVGSFLGFIFSFINAELLAGFKSAKKYLSIDYKFVRNLKSELGKYSPKMSEKEMAEADHLEAVIINAMPENPQEMGFKNTGLKTAEGKTIWAGKKSGRLVIFADSSDFAGIALSVTDVIPAVLSKKGDGFEISAIAVDEAAGLSKNMNYLGDLLVIRKSYYDELLSLAGYDVKIAGERIRNEREAGKNAAARNFVMDLSGMDLTDAKIKDIARALSGYNKAGNAQIAIPYSFLEKLAAGRFEMENAGKVTDNNEKTRRKEEIKKKILAEWSGAGLRVFAVMDENTENAYNMKAKFIEYGFAGYIERAEGKVKTFRDYTSDADYPAAEISGFASRNELMRQIENSRSDAVKIVNLWNFSELLTGDENDIAAKILEISNMFGRNITKLFKKTVNEQYVTQAVLDLDISAIVDIDKAEMEVLHENIAMAETALSAVNNAEINNMGQQAVDRAKSEAEAAVREALAALMKIPVGKSIELNMLNMEISENTAEADMEKVRYAFLKTVAQKAKAKADLYAASPLGLEDKELERLFIKSALSQYAVDRNIIIELERDLQVPLPNIDPLTGKAEELSASDAEDVALMENNTMVSALSGQSPVMSAREAYDAVAVRAKELALRDGVAAATIYEMILLYAERKTDTAIKEKSLAIDTKSLTAMLAAA